MAGEHVLEFTDSNWQAEVVSSDQPVLVDFWAPWCGPCRAIAPHVEALAAQYAGKARVGKVNVDDNQQVAGQYGVRSIPTVLVIKGGQVVDQVVGAVGKDKLDAMLSAQL
ncbi:MAG: thioredoxin [Deltaproteobacteria bacterium]|nr:thioredoxin [Deltaproteobacteria bacterium]